MNQPEKNCFTCMHRVNGICLSSMRSILNGFDFCKEYSHTLSVDAFSSAYVASVRNSSKEKNNIIEKQFRRVLDCRNCENLFQHDIGKCPLPCAS